MSQWEPCRKPSMARLMAGMGWWVNTAIVVGAAGWVDYRMGVLLLVWASYNRAEWWLVNLIRGRLSFKRPPCPNSAGKCWCDG